MAAATATPAFDYSQIGSLDWFEWRALLWDVLPALQTNGEPDWEDVARRMALLFPRSATRSPAEYANAVQALQRADFLPRENNVGNGAGIRAWSDSLYSQVPRLMGGARPEFMNLGYAHPQGNPLELEPKDEPNRLPIQLYERCVRGIDLAGRRVLESGCGFGGGCLYLKRRNAASVTGLDAMRSQIEACRQTYREPGLSFESGEAGNLPFENASFDLVLSVESSGHYPSFAAFVAEAHRVLHPGGELVIADLRPTNGDWGPGRNLQDLAAELDRAGFEITAASDLSAGVLASLAAQDGMRKLFLAQMDEGAPKNHFREIMLDAGAQNRQKLERGHLQYWLFRARKPQDATPPAIHQATIDVNVLSAAFTGNPFPVWDVIRRCEPVHWNERWGGWILTRWEDVSAALKDPRLSIEAGVAVMFEILPEEVRAKIGPLRNIILLWLGALDRPTHLRIRGALQRGFTNTSIQSLRPLITSVTKELIAGARDEGSMDVVRRLAFPLPATIVAALLGTPREDWHRFEHWSRAISEFTAYGLINYEVMYRAQDVMVEMTGYLRAQVERVQRGEDCDGLIAAVLRSEENAVNVEELLANCTLLLFAGHETTTLLLSNSVLALLTNDDARRQLQRDGVLSEAAIHELARYDSPVQLIRRMAIEDLEIGGRSIRKGQMVWMGLGAANRDPEVFPNPGVLDLNRKHNRHLAFGLGSHYCLGTQLAILEAQIAIRTLFDTYPGLRLAGDLHWLPNPTGRCLETLPVTW